MQADLNDVYASIMALHQKLDAIIEALSKPKEVK